MPHSFHGQPTEVLVLGTAHLQQATSDAALEGTLDRLLSWQPDVIAVELLPGDVIQQYRHEGDTYADLQVGGYQEALQFEALARRHCSWTRVEAEALALDPATTPEQRVLAWLVALEPINALLTWTPALELPGDVAQALLRYAAWKSETHRLAVPLAKQLGHKRMPHFDDFTNTGIGEQMQVIRELWNDPSFRDEVERHRVVCEGTQLLEQASAGDDYWSYLRHFNSDQWVQDSADLEVGTYLRHPLAQGAHRARVADWNTRNLFMAARLRKATTPHPAARILAIVGFAHKGPLEAALASISPDIKITGLSELEGASQE